MIESCTTGLILALTSAATDDRVSYELARLRDASDPQLVIGGIILVGVFIGGYAVYLYRKDAAQLGLGVRLLLPLLRVVALAGLAVYFLGVEKRSTQEFIVPSQVAVLVDVSLSMGLSDNDSSGIPAGPTRSQRVAATLTESSLLDQLRRQHDLLVTRFDQQSDPVATLQKHADGKSSADGQVESAVSDDNTTPAQNWSELLLPRGTETRLGDAVQTQLEEHREGPLAAIVIISDGVSNAGVDPVQVAQLAKAAGVPLHTIGIGSVQPPRSLTLADVVAPRRAFPGDLLTITAYVQGYGYAGNLVDVELLRTSAEEEGVAPVRVATERAVLGPDDEILPVVFELEPSDAGRFIYEVVVKPPVGDVNNQDNRREVAVDIVDQETRVLLMAGGPSRDYRFLRNALYRDASMYVDVWLQSAPPGISQEADRILVDFPTAKEELFPYDCIVAIDPDWTRLDAAQVELITEWVAEEAGGMVVVAGPVHTPRWIRSAEHVGIKALYPVEFRQRMTLLDDGYHSGENAWPIEFQRAGREAEFLWLDHSAASSQLAWEAHPGVYSYYDVKGAKPAATVFGRVADPEMGWEEEQPLYLASQFYGAGRVFYAGSAEFWRLRLLDPAYFDILWTKLIRHVSQGRLLRGSAHGSLMVERDRYELGETVLLRARLSDAQHEPLLAGAVSGRLLRPDATTETVQLEAVDDQPGMFVGQFTPLQEGAYRVALSQPGRADQELTRRIQVRIPDLERRRPSRDAALLAEIARDSDAIYFPDLASAVDGSKEVQPLAETIPDRTETKLIQSAPDAAFARQQRHLLLALVAGALLCEWTVRRFCRLA